VDDLLGSFRWYDALCISQADTAGRSEQAPMMGDTITVHNLSSFGCGKKGIEVTWPYPSFAVSLLCYTLTTLSETPMKFIDGALYQS
jgi:hypothetical protein